MRFTQEEIMRKSAVSAIIAVFMTIAVGALVLTQARAGAGGGYGFTFDGFDGEPLPLEQFAGKPVLVVNTATECGFTPQFEGLEALWRQYKDKGLVIVGVPSDDFGGQEPRQGQDIKNFCKINYGVSFPLADRTRVRGGDAHPFYRWALAEAGSEAKPRWNFHKYLIGADGRLAAWFDTQTEPQSEKIVEAVEKALEASPK